MKIPYQTNPEQEDAKKLAKVYRAILQEYKSENVSKYFKNVRDAFVEEHIGIDDLEFALTDMGLYDSSKDLEQLQLRKIINNINAEKIKKGKESLERKLKE